jgi:hypothetical protein
VLIAPVLHVVPAALARPLALAPAPRGVAVLRQAAGRGTSSGAGAR